MQLEASENDLQLKASYESSPPCSRCVWSSLLLSRSLLPPSSPPTPFCTSYACMRLSSTHTREPYLSISLLTFLIPLSLLCPSASGAHAPLLPFFCSLSLPFSFSLSLSLSASDTVSDGALEKFPSGPSPTPKESPVRIKDQTVRLSIEMRGCVVYECK